MIKRALLGRISDVDIRLLRVFRAVVACGGVSAAELELNIGRSTISRHLTDLELRLGVKLYERGPAGFALTTEGEQIFDASTDSWRRSTPFRLGSTRCISLSGHLAIALFDKLLTNREARLSEAIALSVRSFEVTIETTRSRSTSSRAAS